MHIRLGGPSDLNSQLYAHMRGAVGVKELIRGQSGIGNAHQVYNPFKVLVVIRTLHVSDSDARRGTWDQSPERPDRGARRRHLRSIDEEFLQSGGTIPSSSDVQNLVCNNGIG